MTVRAIGLVAALAVAASGCLSPDTSFGRPCTASSECAGAFLCVDGMCVPSRQRGDMGESCAAPLPLVQVGAERLPLAGETALAGARSDYNASCAAGDDVVFSFSLTEPTPLRIRAEATVEVALSMRSMTGGACTDEVVDGCANGPELVVARAEAGAWAVIVHGSGTRDDVVRVTVERLDCPLGYLPFGEGRCAGFRPVVASGIPRKDAKLTTLPDGRAILTGGIEADGVPASAGEVFEPASETWSYIAFRKRRASHSPTVLGDNFIVLGGGDEPEILRRASSGGDLVEPLDYSHNVRLDSLYSEGAHETGVGTPAGALLVVLDEATYLMQIEHPPIPCFPSTGCIAVASAVCVAGIDSVGNPLPEAFCLCPDGPCVDEPVLSESVNLDGAMPRNAASKASPAVATMRGDREVILLHNGDAMHALDVASGFWRRIQVAAREDVALTAIDGGAVIAGGVEEGSASARVELVDSLTRSVVPLDPLQAARVGHAQARMIDGRILVAGGTGADGTAVDTAELISSSPGLATGDLPRLPRLPVALSRASAATLPDGRVVLVGAGPGDELMSTALVFETIPSGAAPPTPDLSAFCGAVEPMQPTAAVGPSEAPAIRETTVGELDRFRDASCGTTLETIGPERLFAFRLNGTAAFYAETSLPYASLNLWRGRCDEHDALGCLSVSEDVSRLEAPTLPPGDYVLVVEAHEDIGKSIGTVFELTAWLGEPHQCPAGAEDPADDTAAGARRLDVLIASDDPADANVEGASGTLCRGDVDHLIVELWSAESELWLDNAAQNSSTLAPAIIDDDASLATGVPVFTFGAPLPFGRGTAPPGIYLLKLGIGEDDPLLHEWSMQHYPVHCMPDDADSLATVLDDGQNAQRRVVLPIGERVVRCITSPSDIDVSIVELPADADATLSIDDASQTSVQLFMLAAPDAAPGAAIGDPIVSGAHVVLPLGTSPWVAAVATSPRTVGDLYSLVLTRSEPGGTCVNALPLSDSGSLPYDSDLFGADLDPQYLGGCTGYGARGSDIVGSFTLGNGDRIDATIDPVTDGDVSIYLLVSCAMESSSCVAGTDDGFPGDSESLSYTHGGPERRYFLVGDSYDADPYSAVLSWSVTRAGQ